MRIYQSKPINHSKQLLNTFFFESNTVPKFALDKKTEPFLIEIALNEKWIVLDTSNPDNPQYRITDAGIQHRDA